MAKRNGSAAVAEPEPEPIAPSSLAIVSPVVDAGEAKKAWNQYQELCREILDDSDYVFMVRYRKPKEPNEEKPKGFRTRAMADAEVKKLKALGIDEIEVAPRKKRSAWDKLSRFFGLTVPKMDGPLVQTDVVAVGPYVVEKQSGEGFSLVIYQDAADLRVVKARATVSVCAPNGRNAIGEAYCSVSERRKGADSFAHADHDVPTTAFTRALNRAVSRCIGAGEVSAEEMEVEMSKAEESSEKVSAPSPAPPTAAASNPPEAKAKEQPKPTPEAAAPSETAGKTIAQRIEALQLWAYGAGHQSTTKRPTQLVKYALLLVPKPANPAPKIESKPGTLDVKAWKAAFLEFTPEQRREKVAYVESLATAMKPAEFLEWAGKNAEATWGQA